MQRHHAFATFVLVLIGSLPFAARDAVAQDWATKMFKVTSHNFGTVARNAKVEYSFEFYNPYKEMVHVAAVSSSCGCTSPEVTKSNVSTYERSEILAKFNTRAFTGNHSATITVTIDRPYYATVQLNVWGDIRGDLEVKSADTDNDSGLVDFGTVDQGEPAVRKMSVVHYGRSDWQIVDVRSVNSSYEVEVVDGQHSAGKVSYNLIVRLKKNAATGYIHDPLILVTNDSQVAQFPIEVQGIVKAPLSVSSSVLLMGTVEAGQQVSKRIIVTGQKPFKVVAVHCDDDSFSFKIPSGAAKLRVIPVTFAAPNKPGKIVTKIQIETDMGKSVTLEVLAQAQVNPSAATANDSPAPKPEVKSPAKETPKQSPATIPTIPTTVPTTLPTTGNVLKLESINEGGSTGAASTGNRSTDAASTGAAASAAAGANNHPAGETKPAVKSAVPAAEKPSSVMPNPIRSNILPSIDDSSAAAS